MSFLLTLVELAVYLFGSWTLAYHAVLVTRTNALFTLIPFVVIFGIVARWRWRAWWRSVVQLRRRADRRLLLATLFIGLVIGILTLIVNRPDGDDIGFFHRALVQPLTDPYIITDTLHNWSGLAPLSVLHVATSYEPLFTFLGEIPGIDPLSAHHNTAAFLSVLLMAATYVLLYRQLRLNRRMALLATVCAFAFLLYDGGVHRSFGNMAFVRLWQGKTILWSVFIPMLLLFSLRYLHRPLAERFVPVVMLGIGAVGLSNTGVFQFPVLSLGIGLACVLVYGLRYWRRAFMLIAGASAYCAIPVLLLLTDVLPKPVFVTAGYSEEATWAENLDTAIGGTGALLRNGLILLLLPLAALRRMHGWFLLALTLIFIAMFLNPVTAPIWFSQILRGGVYWRMVYVFPLPLCAGLIVVALARGGLLRYGAATLVLLAMVATYSTSVLNSAAYIALKSPWEYRLTDNELAFVRTISARLDHANMLATDWIAVNLQLIQPTIRYEAGRTVYTRQVFQDSNLPDEQFRRLAAQRMLEQCTPSAQGANGLRVALRNGLDGIVMRDCGSLFTTYLLLLSTFADAQFIIAERGYGYLWLDRVGWYSTASSHP
jgi:hypothetical protein